MMNDSTEHADTPLLTYTHIMKMKRLITMAACGVALSAALQAAESSAETMLSAVAASSAEDLLAEGKRLYDEKNFSEAFKYLHAAAQKGHPRAQCAMGVMYTLGEGVEKNMAEAAKWYRLAAEQGHAEAQYNLGWCYENGKGVEKNAAEAVKWYRAAAEQGHAEAFEAINATD